MWNDTELRERNEQLITARNTEQVEPTTKSEGVFIGVDLGQSHDFTAIIIVERVKITSFAGWVETCTDRIELNDPLCGKQPTYKHDIEYHVRHIERVRLGTSYHDIVKHLFSLIHSLELREIKPVLVIDAGGVGRAIFDMLKESGVQDVIALTTTSGDSIRREGARWYVPKEELVSCVKGLFGRNLLRIAEGLELRDKLTDELRSFMLKVTDSGHGRYEAASEGQHDDLISALALAAFGADQLKPVPLVKPVAVKKRHGDGFRLGHRFTRSSLS